MTTTNAVLASLVKVLEDQYREQLKRLPLKEPIRNALASGFHDGALTAAQHTCRMLGVEIKER